MEISVLQEMQELEEEELRRKIKEEERQAKAMGPKKGPLVNKANTNKNE